MVKNYLRKLYDEGRIVVFSPDVPFNPEYQIEPDAINLRLHPLAMKLRDGVTEIDLLDSQTRIKNYFEPCPMPSAGLILKPGELIFAKTLETLAIYSDKHIGFVFGRRTIAGFGLSISLDQPKFPASLPWNFPLQLRNNMNSAMKIYPYMYIAQLILIEYPMKAKRSYRGIYRGYIDNYVPNIDELEQQAINETRDSLCRYQPNEVNKRDRVEELLTKHDQERSKQKKKPIAMLKNALLSIIDPGLQFLVSLLALLIITDVSSPLNFGFWLYMSLGIVIAGISVTKFSLNRFK